MMCQSLLSNLRANETFCNVWREVCNFTAAKTTTKKSIMFSISMCVCSPYFQCHILALENDIPL